MRVLCHTAVTEFAILQEALWQWYAAISDAVVACFLASWRTVAQKFSTHSRSEVYCSRGVTRVPALTSLSPGSDVSSDVSDVNHAVVQWPDVLVGYATVNVETGDREVHTSVITIINLCWKYMTRTHVKYTSKQARRFALRRLIAPHWCLLYRRAYAKHNVTNRNVSQLIWVQPPLR